MLEQVVLYSKFPSYASLRSKILIIVKKNQETDEHKAVFNMPFCRKGYQRRERAKRAGVLTV